MKNQFLSLNTPVGELIITANDTAITSVQFFDQLPDDFVASTEPSLHLLQCADQLKEYFSGKRNSFDLPLDPSGTDFQKRVWNALIEIPFAETTSYLALSKKLGDEKAIRAVGLANGKNPVAIIIPCHRVIGSDGSLTGYAGGLHRKDWLLRHEGGWPKSEQLDLFA